MGRPRINKDATNIRVDREILNRLEQYRRNNQSWDGLLAEIADFLDEAKTPRPIEQWMPGQPFREPPLPKWFILWRQQRKEKRK